MVDEHDAPTQVGGGMELIYVADPMCSWCYGFARPLGELLDQTPMPLTMVMGGLRPYTTEPLGADKAREILGHWHRVADASGQPFAASPHAAMEADGFVYDTEPAARALVVVREHWPERAWEYLKAIQRAFYADARDITQGAVLADVAAEIGLPRDEFATEFASEAAHDATARDFGQSQAWGLTGFPALIAERNGKLHLVAQGYTPLATLRERLDRLAAQADDAA